MKDISIGSLGAFIIAAMVIGFIGSYALLYPNTVEGNLALGALLTLPVGIGSYFFHTASNSFLGAQLGAQRASYLAQTNYGAPSTGPSNTQDLSTKSTTALPTGYPIPPTTTN